MKHILWFVDTLTTSGHTIHHPALTRAVAQFAPALLFLFRLGNSGSRSQTKEQCAREKQVALYWQIYWTC